MSFDRSSKLVLSLCLHNFDFKILLGNAVLFIHKYKILIILNFGHKRVLTNCLAKLLGEVQQTSTVEIVNNVLGNYKLVKFTKFRIYIFEDLSGED